MNPIYILDGIVLNRVDQFFIPVVQSVMAMMIFYMPISIRKWWKANAKYRLEKKEHRRKTRKLNEKPKVTIVGALSGDGIAIPLRPTVVPAEKHSKVPYSMFNVIDSIIK